VAASIARARSLVLPDLCCAAKNGSGHDSGAAPRLAAVGEAFIGGIVAIGAGAGATTALTAGNVAASRAVVTVAIDVVAIGTNGDTGNVRRGGGALLAVMTYFWS